MMRKYFAIACLFSIVLTGCKPSPEAITYGSDVCHFCSMTIVDQQHAAEYVTKKGRAYKFDASECMQNALKEVDTATVALYLVNDYNSPGELIDATTATYLISEDIPSPMGAFLTAFPSRKAAETVRSQHQGKLFIWKEMQNRFNHK